MDMDDGDANGKDQLIRLRTTAGHQILMKDDAEYTSPEGGTYKTGFLYISSASGQQWIELSPNGAINIFGAGGFNLRSKGAINMHSDAAIAMCAPAIKIDAVVTGTTPTKPAINASATNLFTWL